ncbi:uncharacterized protein DS421_16g537830 [Arachis hypogaea]|nr:uncharacterized protein DS421_16g537830 [Arachis hypogaea]
MSGHLLIRLFFIMFGARHLLSGFKIQFTKGTIFCAGAWWLWHTRTRTLVFYLDVFLAVKNCFSAYVGDDGDLISKIREMILLDWEMDFSLILWEGQVADGLAKLVALGCYDYVKFLSPVPKIVDALQQDLLAL